MRKRLVIALAVAGLLSVGFGASILPASADPRTLVVTLASGEQRTVSVDLPTGANVNDLHIPGISEQIVAVSDITPAAPQGIDPPPAQTTATTQQAAPAATGTATTSTATTDPAPAAPAAAPATATTPATTAAPAPATTAVAPAASETEAAAAKAAHKAAEKKAAKRRAAEKAAERKPAAIDSERQPSGDDADTSDAKSQAKVEGGDATATTTPATSTSPATTLAPTADAAVTPGAVLGTGPTAVGVPNFFIDRFRIPPFLLPIYQAAGIQYGVRWEVLAAINEIETDYGRNLNVSTAGALGWMQFMPATWKMYGVDANDDGVRDPFNPVDAIFAAARYLKAAGASTDLRRSIFAYNHADWYVDSVLERAQVIAGMPVDLVSSLTGLTQGHFPVAAPSRYTDQITAKDATRTVTGGNAAQTVESSATRRGIDIYAKAGSAVTAVQDGTVVARGRTKRLGTYLKLRDAYGNTYTYAHLQDVSSQVPVPKPSRQSEASVAKELKLPAADPRPTRAATAGRQRTTASSQRTAAATASTKSGKERLFANPRRASAYTAGGRSQLEDAATSLPEDATMARYFTVDMGLKRDDVVLKPLVVGRRIVAGTILARLRTTRNGGAPNLHFEIRPAGHRAPRIDPKPILDGWKLLESTAVYRAGSKAFASSTGDDPSIGQMLLMSKEDLGRRVLTDHRITIYSCGRQDIQAGIVDRRVLATLLFLATNGLDPTVSALRCGHGYLTSSGNVSEHSSGSAVDIAAINGTPILGHQGAGSITDTTIRKLLELQGAMQPHQIISLMKYPNADNTLALPDHNDHIHVGFHPEYDPATATASATATTGDIDSALKPNQWAKLMDRLGSIDNPKVSASPSKYALSTADDPG